VLRIGLTGGTGAGKSTVAGRLAELGALVVDADVLAREVVAPGSPGLAEVAAEFGDGVLTADGALDRAALAGLVFADPGRRQALERITHPRIAARTAELLADAPADAVVVHDVPLLVEKRMGPGYHLVVVVDAPEDVRVGRLVASRGMTEDDARARVRAQATDDERRAAADVWLDNSGEPGAVLEAVDALWRQRIRPYADHLRARTPARRPEVVAVVPHDPTWPVQAARLLARVRRAVGSTALSLEHVGSTSVPGLPAKDVLDVQLVVADLETADGLRAALEDAGLARPAGDWWDRGPDGGRLPKRVHTACDPGRAVNLHVRPQDSPFVRSTLAFRDWLRAHGDERDAYAAVKARAAGPGDGVGVQEYLRRKDPWVTGAVERALAWAAGGER
jgi:dephospho-CoA kinase